MGREPSCCLPGLWKRKDSSPSKAFPKEPQPRTALPPPHPSWYPSPVLRPPASPHLGRPGHALSQLTWCLDSDTYS